MERLAAGDGGAGAEGEEGVSGSELRWVLFEKQIGLEPEREMGKVVGTKGACYRAVSDSPFCVLY